MPVHAETPLFFANGGVNLFGVLHSAATQDASSIGILMCHPFGEEKLWSHRAFVTFARHAAADGFPVFRFDFRGQGDSDGDTDEVRIDHFFSDLLAAQNYFLAHCKAVTSLVIVGLRFGATIAAISSISNPRIRRLVLWEPIVSGARYMQELLRINLATQLAVYGKVLTNRQKLIELMHEGVPANVDGYLVSEGFFNDGNEIDLLQYDYEGISVPVLVTQIAANLAQKDNRALVDLADVFRDGTFNKVQEQPFWREIKQFRPEPQPLIRETLAWIDRDA